MPLRVLIAIAVPFAFAALTGCQPQIGDRCNNSTDCSVNGDRLCDLAQPNGYCTIAGCDPDSCPNNALCVEFRPTPSRTAQTFCMERCKGNGGCRGRYTCAETVDGAYTPEGADQPLAEVIDLDGRADDRFCIAVETE